MAETRATITTKEMETRVFASLQDEIKNMEFKFPLKKFWGLKWAS